MMIGTYPHFFARGLTADDGPDANYRRETFGGVLSNSGFTNAVISVRHFFGIRHAPLGLEPSIQLGHVTGGNQEFPVIASLKQIHSTRVIALHSPVGLGVMEQTDGDALVTDHPQILLVVRTADCVPVLLVETERGVVGAIHAGWRGVVGGVVPETIRTCVENFGVKKEHMHVAIGPSIGPCCYEVDEPVIEPVRARFPDWPHVLQETTPGKGVLDLKKLVHHQIVASGIPDCQVGQVDQCTYCRADLFYSYRREGQVNGTMLSGIMLPDA